MGNVLGLHRSNAPDLNKSNVLGLIKGNVLLLNSASFAGNLPLNKKKVAHLPLEPWEH